MNDQINCTHCFNNDLMNVILKSNITLLPQSYLVVTYSYIKFSIVQEGHVQLLIYHIPKVLFRVISAQDAASTFLSLVMLQMPFTTKANLSLFSFKKYCVSKVL